MIAPQIELLTGEDVIGQVPVVQPINFQYRNPPVAPSTIPSSVSQCLLKNNFAMRLLICCLLINISTCNDSANLYSIF